MSELNKILKQMLGKPMNKKQKHFLNHLREQVKSKQITVEEAKQLWNEKYRVWKS